MIPALATLLVFQLMGEVVVMSLGLPVPGPVVGLALLLTLLVLRPATMTRSDARALLRARSDVQSAAAFDLKVYRDQLNEVDRDLARGTLAADEADRLRTEVSRRLLEACTDLDLHMHNRQGHSQPIAYRLTMSRPRLGGSLKAVITFADPPRKGPRPKPEPPTGKSGLMGAQPAAPAKPADVPMVDHGEGHNAPVTAR